MLPQKALKRENKLDLHETPEIAVEKLLERVTLPHRIWEPACGPGALAAVLRDHGHQIYMTDIVHYTPWQHEVVDFLKVEAAPEGYDTIVTNPPYGRNPLKFVEHGLGLVPNVVMLLRLSFLEGQRRKPFFIRGHLRRVLVFSERLPMMHRAGWTGNKATSNIPYAWFVFDNDAGPTTVEWI